MSETAMTLKFLTGFAARAKSAEVEFSAFCKFVQGYADKNVSKNNSLDIYASNTRTVLTAELEELARQGTCTLEYNDSAISSITYSGFIHDTLNKLYGEIEQNPATPFPGTESFSISIPEDLVQVINVKNDFVDWLGHKETTEPFIMRMEFPEGFRNMLVTSQVFFHSLLKLSLEKVRKYLRDQTNFKYVANRLGTVFSKQEVVVQGFLDDIVERPQKTVEGIENPTDFTFRAWTTMGNLIIHDIKQKVSKLADDIGIGQALYLIGFYNVAHKNEVREKREQESTVKQLGTALKKAPYYHTISEIYNFTTDKGATFLAKMGKDKIHSYLQKKTTPGDNSAFPEIMRVRTHTKKDYFIETNMILPLVLKKLNGMSDHIRNELAAEWTAALQSFEKPAAMKSDSQFAKDIQNRAKEKDPLLWALLKFELLFMLTEEPGLTSNVRNDVLAMLDPGVQKLKPLPEILRIDRDEMFRYAKGKLPLWMTTPVLKGLFRFFIKMFTGSKKDSPRKEKKKGVPKSISSGTVKTYGGSVPSGGKSSGSGGASPRPANSSQAAKARLSKFRSHVQKLQEEYVDAGDTVNHTLEGLIDKWNNLLDAQARKNLVEDVNAAIRDYVRKFKQSLINNPPGREDLQRIAIKLSEQSIFSGIKGKEAFWRYIELYLLKLLSRE